MPRRVADIKQTDFSYIFSMKSSGSKIYKAVALVTVFGVATRAVGFLFKVYVGRKLGAEAVGLYQMALSVLFLLSAVASSGVPLVLSRRIAALDGDEKAGRLVSSGLLICGTISACLIAVFYACGDNLAVLFGDKRALPVFFIVLPTLLSTSVYAVVRAYFLGKKQYFAFSVAELSEEVVRVLSCIAFCSKKSPFNGATSIAFSFLISDLVSGAVLSAIYFAIGGRLKKPSDVKPTVKSAVPITLIRISGSLVSSLTAVIVPFILVRSGMTPSEATADYGRVTGMSLPLLMAPLAITGALATVLVPEVASSQKTGLCRKIDSATLFAAIIGSFFVLVYAPLGESIGTFLFNDSRAGKYVGIAAVIIYPLELNQISTSVLNSLGRERTTFLHFVIGSLVTVACLFVLPAKIGVYAILCGMLLCFGTTTFLNFSVLLKKEGLELNFKKPISAVFAAAPSALLCYLLKNLLLLRAPIAVVVIVPAFVSCLAYAVTLWAFGIVDAEAVLPKRKTTALVRLPKKAKG